MFFSSTEKTTSRNYSQSILKCPVQPPSSDNKASNWDYFVNIIGLHFKHRGIFITWDYKPQAVDSFE